MPAPYNLTFQYENITSPILMANELGGGQVFGHFIILTVFLITMFGISGRQGSSLIEGATFGAIIGLIVNILLLPLGIVSHLPLAFFIAILIGGMFFPAR